LVVRSPSEDVCGECTIYRNCWKYRSPTTTEEVRENEDDEDEENGNPEVSKQDDAGEREDNDEMKIHLLPLACWNRKSLSPMQPGRLTGNCNERNGSRKNCMGTIHSAPTTFRMPLLLYY
jgi:hypothetical protein